MESQRRNGHWVLSAATDLEVVVSALNAFLGGQRLVLAKHDSRRPQALMRSEWANMHEPVTHAPAVLGRPGQREIYIPVAGGISIPVLPVQFESAVYASEIDIEWDHLSIKVALACGQPKSLEFVKYTLTRTGSFTEE